MSFMEEKKQLSGIKVSAIANKFQSKSITDNYDNKSGFDIEMNDATKVLKESATQVTVVRTESHVARFNNARALFEKLGEETRSNHSCRKKTYVVLLGPIALVNHDCNANCSYTSNVEGIMYLSSKRKIQKAKKSPVFTVMIISKVIIYFVNVRHAMMQNIYIKDN
ncbi:uncharacterized protein LOC107981821 [Nasonia vitripennis]|uniref:Uncharacterized protein n=1 Tax=Nasonia vitripennis TaxID=7425 RepID=A0A7M7PXP5_NASVI|nr:uncharacterized protein LOC107981821 [Nasonia vitripennis]